MVHDFIFELGCEELPSGAVLPLAQSFSEQFLALLDKAQLAYGDVKIFATPRRIAITLRDVDAVRKGQTVTKRGPALAAAYHDGKPTQALLGFAKACGVELSKLTRISTDKGEWVAYESITDSLETAGCLPGFVSQALQSVPIAKPMRWGSGEAEFARPVHWAVMIYGDQVLTQNILGIATSNTSRGHRFHHPQAVTITGAKSYEQQMRDAFVVADFAERRQRIQDQVEQLAEKHQAIAIMPSALLDEVTSLVEWPCALLATFDAAFLAVPAEALIAAMQVHQKCFALQDHAGKLLPYFITVANIQSGNANAVIQGNEKVMRARLSDAVFFFTQDKKRALVTYTAALQQVIFHGKLGSLQDKASRIGLLLGSMGQTLHLSQPQAQRAALLSKCDLLTGMVSEFPELQGIMGYYYALHDKEEAAVAQALQEQYMPRYAGDALPQSNLGLALSLADRLDTLVGLFAMGQKPSGVKDPFKLRRHAAAVVRLLIATPASIHVSTLIEETIKHYGTVILDKSQVMALKPFILERVQSIYQSQGIAADLIMAVRSRQDEWLFDFDKRLRALQAFVNLPEAASLAAACKRVNNLLTQAGMDGEAKPVDASLLEEGAETFLYQQIERMATAQAPLYVAAEYGLLLKQLASLKAPVDDFFDCVMVMVDNQAIKHNRLALLARLQTLLQGVADIALLQVSSSCDAPYH